MPDLHRSLCESFTIKPFSNLITENITAPDFQRLLSLKHVDEIYNEIKNKLEQKLSPLLPGCLVVCETSSGTKWLVDGNHRYQAYLKILNDYKEDLTVAVNYIQVSDIKEASSVFNMVNHSIAVPKMPDGISLNLPNQLYREIEKKYPKLFSESKKCQRPKLHRDSFIEALGKMIEKVGAEQKITPEDFMIRFERYNSLLKKRNWREFITKPGDKQEKIYSLQEKCVLNGNVFVGMLPDFQWLTYIYLPHIEPETKTKPKGRVSIGSALKKAVWEKHKKPGNIVNCYHCKTNLDFTEFECGHIISVAEGGNTTVNNLTPVCSMCNRSVGKKNAKEFNDKHGITA